MHSGLRLRRWGQLLIACLSGVVVVGAAPITASARLLSAASAMAPDPHPTSAAAAVRELNAQRVANGIPGDLTLDPQLSQGCWNHTNLYIAKPGQYPHTELSSQPGYTPLGAEAAGASDLGGEASEWGSMANPWYGAPYHLAALFDPAATTGWYGETAAGRHDGSSSQGACMGTDGSRAFSAPTFYAVVDTTRTKVRPYEVVAESPITPETALGFHRSVVTGPNILLLPEDTDASVSDATLNGPHGDVPVRVVRPNTPASCNDPSFGSNCSTPGGVTVVVAPKLRPTSPYTLTATWVSGSHPYTQVVSFRTTTDHAASVAGGRFDLPTPRGLVGFTITSGRMYVTLHPAVGQVVTVKIGREISACGIRRTPCPKNQVIHLRGSALRTYHIKMHSSRSRGITLPAPPPPESGSKRVRQNRDLRLRLCSRLPRARLFMAVVKPRKALPVAHSLAVGHLRRAGPRQRVSHST